MAKEFAKYDADPDKWMKKFEGINSVNKQVTTMDIIPCVLRCVCYPGLHSNKRATCSELKKTTLKLNNVVPPALFEVFNNII